MPLTTRQQLSDYCLRRLGAPVIEINVDDDQVSDRLDDALQYWNEYHFDGTDRVYLKAQVVASKFVLANAGANSQYVVGEKVKGFTSNTIGIVWLLDPDGITVHLQRVTGTFQDGETVTGLSSGWSASLAATNAYTVGNWDTGYLDTTDAITGVIRVFQIGTGATGSTTNNIFDVVYQFRLNDMYDLMSTDLIYYSQMKQHLETLDMLLPGQRTFRFNRKQNRVYIDCNWWEAFRPGDYLIVECYAITDPNDFPKVYDDMFLKKYATALIKRQWASNMSKFKGIQLPGGVTLNGTEMYQEANKEIETIEEEMQNRYELPPMFIIG
jgi:hypothetical protein